MTQFGRHQWRDSLRRLAPAWLLTIRRRVIQGIRRLRYRFERGRTGYWDDHAHQIHELYGALQHDYECLTSIFYRTGAKRVLDVGCGSGRLFGLYEGLSVVEVVGQDTSREALAIASTRCGPNTRLIDTPLARLEFPRDYFDIAICNRVLQHIPRLVIGSVLQAICRVSRRVYLNELSASDGQQPTDVMFMHDYANLFHRLNFELEASGVLLSETGTQQRWQLWRRIA